MRANRAGSPRPLSSDELELVEALLGGAGAGAGRYLSQLDRLQAVGGCGCGCPSIDLAVNGEVHDAAARPLVLADAESPEGVPVGVILWVRGGALSGLEVHPWDGTRAVRLPRPESLLNLRKENRNR